MPEEGSIEARRLSHSFELIAPDLIFAECANIVWKKVQRGDIPAAQSISVVETLTRLDVEIFALRNIATLATQISAKLDHPAYDCFYLALAILENCRLVTADDSLIRVVRQKAGGEMIEHCVRLHGFSQ